MFYSSEPEALRIFLGEKLGFQGTDIGEGWIIFNLPEADMGVHPTDHPGSPPSGTADLSFYCDDLESTMSELGAKGVKFAQEPEDHGYGWVTYLMAPGDLKILLYQPKYAKN